MAHWNVREAYGYPFPLSRFPKSSSEADLTDSVAVDAKRILLRYGAPIAILDKVSESHRIEFAREIAKTILPDREHRLRELLAHHGYADAVPVARKGRGKKGKAPVNAASPAKAQGGEPAKIAEKPEAGGKAKVAAKGKRAAKANSAKAKVATNAKGASKRKAPAKATPRAKAKPKSGAARSRKPKAARKKR